MMPPKVLVVGGSDPTSGAGVQADIKAMSLFGVHGCTVVTCCTTQNTQSFKTLGPLEPDAVLDQINVLLEDMTFDVAKLGLLGTVETMEAVGQRLSELSLKVVVDPVLSFTTGGALPEEIVKAYREHILPNTWLVTPNIAEARLLTDRKDCGRPLAEALRRLTGENVVITGGHGDPRTVDVLLTKEGWSKHKSPRLDGEFHGTGCAFASMVAACTSLGMPVEESVARSKRMLYNRILIDFKPGKGVGCIDLVSPNEDVIQEVSNAANRFCSVVPAAMVPEVGTNIAYALPHAIGYMDMAGLEGRIVRGPSGPMRVGCASIGAARHTARIVLAAMSHDPSVRCAINIRYSPETMNIIEEEGISISSFDRNDEPDRSSSMEWGTLAAIESFGGVPQAIYDIGGFGKEAMIRILARNPGTAMNVVETVAGKTVKA